MISSAQPPSSERPSWAPSPVVVRRPPAMLVVPPTDPRHSTGHLRTPSGSHSTLPCARELAVRAHWAPGVRGRRLQKSCSLAGRSPRVKKKKKKSRQQPALVSVCWTRPVESGGPLHGKPSRLGHDGGHLRRREPSAAELTIQDSIGPTLLSK